MTTLERESVAAICLMAAFADGAQSEPEREKLREVMAEIGAVDDNVFQRVVMGRTTLEDEARKLSDPATASLAYSLAAATCAADGATSAKEQAFLAQLAGALRVKPEDAASELRSVDALASGASSQRAGSGAVVAGAAAAASVSIPPGELADINLADVTGDPSVASSLAGASGFGSGAGNVAGAAGSVTGAGSAKGAGNPQADKEADEAIMKYAAIIAGVELLPQTLATVAVLPLQARMVYRIGSLYGYKLDSGHIKEFAAAVGVGMTSQVVESFARKFLGAIAGKFLGKTVGKITTKATGPIIAFGTTYALGHVAKAYYAGGRTLSMSDLRGLFTRKVEEAKGVYTRNEGSIMNAAKKLDPTKLVQVLKGA